MLPGPDYIYQCPACGDYYFIESISSGNTLESKIYSDGKKISPMLSEFPVITKCYNCNTIFWLSNIKKQIFNPFDYLPLRLMSENRINEYSKFKNAKNTKIFSIFEYSEAVESQIYENNNDEIFLRIRIWWGFNDRVRNNETVFLNKNDKLLWKLNLIRLLEILEIDNINHLFMIAEINRNLGNFKKCLEIINNIKDINYSILKNKLIENCNLKNTKVFQVK